MDNIHLYNLFANTDWSGKVKSKWTPVEGFFKQSAAKIARGLKANSDSKSQAMRRLSFYINRAGKNLSDSDKARLELAKKKLQRLYDNDPNYSKTKSFSLTPGLVNSLVRFYRSLSVYKYFTGFVNQTSLLKLKELLSEAINYANKKYNLSLKVELGELDSTNDSKMYAAYTSKEGDKWVIRFTTHYKFTSYTPSNTTLLHELAHVIYDSIYGVPDKINTYRRHNRTFQSIAEDLYVHFKVPKELGYYKDYEAGTIYGSLAIARIIITDKLIDEWILYVLQLTNEYRKISGDNEVKALLTFNRTDNNFELWSFNTFILDSIQDKDSLLFGVPIERLNSSIGIYYGIMKFEYWIKLCAKLRTLKGRAIKCLIEN